MKKQASPGLLLEGLSFELRVSCRFRPTAHVLQRMRHCLTLPIRAADLGPVVVALDLCSTVSLAGFQWYSAAILIVGSQIRQQPRAWLAVFSWISTQTQITGYGEWEEWTVCALDWFFFVCCTCRDGCRAGDQSISSLLEVAGAIMGNGQEKKKTFNTKVVLFLCCLQIAGALWKLAAPLIGAVC